MRYLPAPKERAARLAREYGPDAPKIADRKVKHSFERGREDRGLYWLAVLMYLDPEGGDR